MSLLPRRNDTSTAWVRRSVLNDRPSVGNAPSREGYLDRLYATDLDRPYATDLDRPYATDLGFCS